MMEQRLSAGGILVVENKVLLVHHHLDGVYDFWVMPGGGMKGEEGIFRCAEREVGEETGLVVRAEKIAYVEELIDEGCYVCKSWVVCRLVSGSLSTAGREVDEEYLQDVGYFSQADVQGMNVYPVILKGIFWQDLQAGFPGIRYLGYSRGND
jgi:8-oxo-dGTP diphosphatase